MTSDYYVNKYFETSDLGLSAALITASYPVDHLDKHDSSKVKFIFSRDDGMDDVIQLYWANELKLSLLAYFNNLKMLKNRIYSDES